MFAQLSRVNELALAQKAATRASELVDIRVEEATIFADLLSLPVNESTDVAARLRFNRWLGGWSRTGYLFDSFIDLRADYLNGESGVRPTLPAHLLVGFVATREGIQTLRQTPPNLVGKCAVSAVKYSLFNVKPAMTGASQS